MDNSEQWESLLDPEIFKDRLINISMYITVYEMLKDSIISRIKDFYIMSLIDFRDFEGEIKYKLEVLSKNKNHLYASILWLLEHNVINQIDYENIENLKKYRNYLAHEMSNIIFNGDITDLMNNFLCAYELINKIENWWIVNFEIIVSPEFNNISIDDINIENIQSGKKIMIDIALLVLSGDKDLLEKFKSMNSKI